MRLTLAEDCGCDGATGLVSLDEAIARGVGLAAPAPETETLPLAAAIGRVLATPVASPLPLPPFDNAAMDGATRLRPPMSPATARGSCRWRDGSRRAPAPRRPAPWGRRCAS
jgi:hypothetical protein